MAWAGSGNTRSRRMVGVFGLVVVLVLGSIVPSGGSSRSAAAQLGVVTPMLPSDALRGPIRGTPEQVISFASRYGARQLADVDAYVREVYRLAPQVGLDPAIVVAQSALETDTWRSNYWANHRNPAGIGITYDGQASFTWANGSDAARGQIVHLYLYAVGVIPAGHVLAPYIPLDPRYDAARTAGYAGVARTIGDLTGRWAVDPIYGDKLAGRGNDILYRYRIAGFTQSSGTTSAALADDAAYATTWRTTTLAPTTAWMTVDLGAAVPLGRVRWLVAQTGTTDQMRVERSLDGVAWQRIAEVGSGPVGQWQGVTIGGAPQTRYVRFWLDNPNASPVLGAIAEVQLWPPATAAYPFIRDVIPPPPTIRASPNPSASPSPSASPAPRAPRVPPSAASPTPTPPGPSAQPSVAPTLPPSTERPSRTIRPAPPPSAAPSPIPSTHPERPPRVPRT